MEDLTSLYIRKNSYDDMKSQILGLIEKLENSIRICEDTVSNIRVNYIVDGESLHSRHLDDCKEQLNLQLVLLRNTILPSIDQSLSNLKNQIRIEEERILAA